MDCSTLLQPGPLSCDEDDDDGGNDDSDYDEEDGV